jgi:hypothetical protein
LENEKDLVLKKCHSDFEQELSIVHAGYTKTITANTEDLNTKQMEIELLHEQISALERRNRDTIIVLAKLNP